jgi:hypothetical protein
MHSAPDLITRWPALEVAAKRARLQNSLRVSPGPLTETLNVATEPAARAALGLWRRDHPALLRELGEMLLARRPRTP